MDDSRDRGLQDKCDQKKKKEVLNRFSRLEGQIRAVRKMIEEGEECEKIMTLLSASHSALEGATRLVVANYFRECLLESQERGEDLETALDRLVSWLLRARV